MDSLRNRLTLALAVILAAFLGLAGLALDRAFQASVETAVRDNLQTRIYLLLGAADVTADGGLEMPRSLSAPRLESPDSGLYAAIRARDGAILWRSRSSLGRAIDYPEPEGPGRPAFARLEGGAQPLYAFAFPVTWELPGGATRRLEFLVAESTRSAEARVESFRLRLWGWLGLAALLLLAAQALLLRWGLRPVDRAAREVAAVEAGAREQLAGDFPRELRPLTDNLNALLATSATRLRRYREALADLGHSLKTPLAVLRRIAEELGPGEPGDEIRRQTERMQHAIHWHLQRGAAAGSGGLVRAVDVAGLAQRLQSSLEKVHADRAVRYEQDIAPGTVFRGDPEDLMELLGNLLDNAWKWAHARVRLEARNGSAGSFEFIVSDDGPGIPPEQRRRVLERGFRGDERVPGEGLGLDLVRQMVEETYGGRIALERSALGGLAVRVELPGPGRADAAAGER